MNKSKKYWLISLFIFIVIFLILLLRRIETVDVSTENYPQPAQQVQLYFAYGSNMSIANLEERCGLNFKSVGPARLDDYEFGFDKRGYANIRPKAGEFVWGFVWEINQECLEVLDRYEGYPNVYGKQDVSVTNGEQRFKAFVYIEPAEEFGGAPQESYLNNKVIPGAEENGLPQEWIKKLREYQ